MLMPAEQIILFVCLAYLGVVGLIGIGLGLGDIFDYVVEKVKE